MQIKSKHEQQSIFDALQSPLRILRRRGVILTALLFAVGAAFVAGAMAHRADLIGPFLEKIAGNIRLPVNMIRGALSNPKQIQLHMNFEDQQLLAYKREVALQRGYLLTEDDSWVKATLVYNNNIYNVDVRLKGDLLDHLRRDKWSYRVEVKGDSALFGMKLFSLQSPTTKNDVHEWLFHELCRREGMIGLRYDFINLSVNGEDVGIYALEESFEKRLIESNSRREGPIIKFNENPWWIESGELRMEPLAGAGHYNSMGIDMFQTGKTLRDSTLARQFAVATSLLSAFQRGQISADEAFDTELMARYFAIVDLLGAFHALNTIQLRFYFNPVNQKLEIIPFDANGGRPTLELVCTFKSEDEHPWLGELRALFVKEMFADPIFYERYLNNLERMSDPKYLDTLLAQLNPQIDEYMDMIYSDFPWHHHDNQIYYRNQEFIRRFIYPTKTINAHLFSIDPAGYLQIEVASVQQLPIQVVHARIGNQILGLDGGDTAGYLPARELTDLMNFKRLRFQTPKGFTWNDTLSDSLFVVTKLPGIDSLYDETVYPWPWRDSSYVSADLKARTPNLEEHKFVQVNKTARIAQIPKGKYQLNKPLVAPSGYKFQIESGVQIDLVDSAYILSYSPVIFTGSDENPILIHSSDTTGSVAVINAGPGSMLRHAVFRTLSPFSSEKWKMTGAVTFYESPVAVSHCIFDNARSEDALNIVHSDFTLDSSVFIASMSDALDLDFCKGEVRSVRFVHCGNDGLDASGSSIKMYDLRVNGAGDKALSIGEGTTAQATGVMVDSAEIGFASKDNSHLSISDVTLRDSHLGFTLFQKKPEFGPATARIYNLTIENVTEPYLIEAGSTCTVDDAEIASNQDQIRDLLYGVKFGKASR